MAILTNLFGKSPLGSLEAHGEKVHACIRLLSDAFRHLSDGDQANVRAAADKISALESEADAIKNSLHEMLASKALIPLRKDDLFGILEQQDLMADCAEEIAVTLTYRSLELPPPLMEETLAFLEKVLKTCELAAGVISKLDLLVESSFAGRDALTVSRLITELAERDDLLMRSRVELTRKIVSSEDQIPPVNICLWLRVFASMAELSRSAIRVGHRLRGALKIDPNP